jgi:hypothetical protein
MGLKEIGCEGWNWIRLAQVNGVRWRPLKNRLMICSVPFSSQLNDYQFPKNYSSP